MSLQSRAQEAVPSQGEVIAGRYRVLESLEEATLWGAAYLVEDMREDGAIRIVQQWNVPPLRQGLEERVEAVRAAVTVLRERSHATRARITDFLEEDKKMWLVLARPSGTSVDALIRTGKMSSRNSFRLKAALSLAEGLHALLDAGQKQAVINIDNRSVYLNDDGQVALTRFNLDLFLRPGPVSYHKPDTIADAEACAIKRFGAVLYAVVMAEPYDEKKELREAELPAGLRSVMARSLVSSRGDAYVSLQALLDDVRTLHDRSASSSAAPAESSGNGTARVAAAPRAPAVGLAPGEVLNDRFKILEVLEAPTLWGALYLVSDLESPKTQLVARRLNIPPLRQELEERVQALRSAVATLREHADPSRPEILEFFEEEKGMWLVTRKAPGADVETLVKSRKTIAKSDWRARVALRFAEAIKSLFDLGQKQAIAALNPRQVLLTPEGQVTLVNQGLGLFLRPGTVSYHRPDSVGNIEAIAIKRFAEVMYGLLTGELYHEGQVIVDADLPEGLGYVVLRALIPSRRDSYKSMDFLLADLRVLQNMVEFERMDVLHWEDFELPPEKPPVWEEIGIARFLLRTVVVWARAARGAFQSQSLQAQVVQAVLALALLAVWIHDAYARKHAPTAYRKSGPVVYVADRSGNVEVWDASTRRFSVTLPTDHEASGLFYSTRTHRLYLSIPSERTIESYWPDDLGMLGSTRVPAGNNRIFNYASKSMIFALADDGQLSTVSLRALTPSRPVSLDEKPVDMVYSDKQQALMLAKDGPPRIEAHSVLKWRTLNEKPLVEPPAAVRLSRDESELWVLGAGGNGVIEVLDPASLEPTARVELGAGHPLDVIFSTTVAYVLMKEGQVLKVDPEIHKVVGGGSKVASDPVAMVNPFAKELWIASRDGTMSILQTESGATERVKLKGKPAAMLSVP